MNALFNRVSRIHEKEFEVLTEAWHKLQDALGYVANLTSPVPKYPDLDRMSESHLREFLENSELTAADKNELLIADDKNEFYQERIYWYRLRDTRKKVADFHNHLLYNKVFLSTDLKTQFEKIDKLLNDALQKSELGTQHRDSKMRSEAWWMLGEIEPLRQEIERLVQRRLRFEEAE